MFVPQLVVIILRAWIILIGQSTGCLKAFSVSQVLPADGDDTADISAWGNGVKGSRHL
jgi:hypothetical protein